MRRLGVPLACLHTDRRPCCTHISNGSWVTSHRQRQPDRRVIVSAASPLGGEGLQVTGPKSRWAKLPGPLQRATSNVREHWDRHHKAPAPSAGHSGAFLETTPCPGPRAIPNRLKHLPRPALLCIGPAKTPGRASPRRSPCSMRSHFRAASACERR